MKWQCVRESKKNSYLLVFVISRYSGLFCCNNMSIYVYVSSVLYLIKNKSLGAESQKLQSKTAVNSSPNFRWHRSTTAAPGPRAGMAQRGWAWWAAPNRAMQTMAWASCEPWANAWQGAYRNHWRGAVRCHHGQRHWWLVLTHGYNDPQSWWQGQHCHTDVRHCVPSDLAPSHTGDEPLPEACCWDQLGWASLTLWRDEWGRSQLMGVPDCVKSCFWQSLSLAELNWAL